VYHVDEEVIQASVVVVVVVFVVVVVVLKARMYQDLSMKDHATWRQQDKLAICRSSQPGTSEVTCSLPESGQSAALKLLRE
jgi:hypothetical protein